MYSLTAFAQLEIQSLQEFKIPTVGGNITNDNAILYNGATGGFFRTEKSDNRHKLIYKAEILNNFNILIAVRLQGYWQLVLRIVTSCDRAFCLPIKNNERLRNNLSIPDKFAMNTALVLCLQNTTFDANIKVLGEAFGFVHWDITSFNVSSLLSMDYSDEYIRMDANFFNHCPECLVISRDGRGHSRQCPKQHTISGLRKHIYSKKTCRLIRCSHVQILEDGGFKDVNNLTLINNVIEGIFQFRTTPSGKTLLSLDTITMNRCCILFAFHHRNAWRIRLLLIFSRKNGILGFIITKTLVERNGQFIVPTTWKANTVLLIGVHPANMDVPMTLRIFANETGVNIQPYDKQILWNFSRDEIVIPDGLKTNNAKNRSYAKQLYSEAQQQFVRSENMLQYPNDQIA